jgi:hypothetical protein
VRMTSFCILRQSLLGLKMEKVRLCRRTGTRSG